MWWRYILNLFFLFLIGCYKSHNPRIIDTEIDDGGIKDLEITDYRLEIKDTEIRDTVCYDDTGTVNNPPVAILTVSPTRVIIGEEVRADGSGSYDPDGDRIVNYRFIWGDESSDEGELPVRTHIYNNPGRYTITLVVRDQFGAVGTTEFNITVLECRTDEDCAIDERCNDRGECVLIPPQRCRREADCTPYGRTCRYFPGGDTGGEELPLACQRPIPNGLQLGERCDQYRIDNVCFNELCNIGGSCSIACVDDNDCPEGYVCRRQLFSVDETKGQYFYGCVPLHIPPESGNSQIIEETETDVTQLSGVSEPVYIHTTNNSSVSLTVVAYGINDPIMDLYEILGPYQLISPESEILFDYETFWFNGELTPLVYLPEYYIVSVMIPNSPVHSLLLGNYEITFKREYYSGPIKVFVHETYNEGNRLNLHIFLVTPQFRKDTASSDPQLQQYLTTLNQIFSQAGIQLGKITYHDVVGLVQNRLRYIDTYEGANSELSELFSLSAGVIDSGINLFIVDDIVDAVGIAGAISGPPGYHGTIHSGIAIGIAWLDMYDGGVVMAHEICHYLGLFHTTEFDGTTFETIPDTPQCGPENDTNNDGFLFPEECQDYDGNNLMFWAGTGSELTQGQAFVIKRFANLERE